MWAAGLRVCVIVTAGNGDTLCLVVHGFCIVNVFRLATLYWFARGPVALKVAKGALTFVCIHQVMAGSWIASVGRAVVDVSAIFLPAYSVCNFLEAAVGLAREVVPVVTGGFAVVNAFSVHAAGVLFARAVVYV
jgi:hypothetical protein